MSENGGTGGYYGDYYPAIIGLSHCNSFEDRVPVDENGLQWFHKGDKVPV